MPRSSLTEIKANRILALHTFVHGKIHRDSQRTESVFDYIYLFKSVRIRIFVLITFIIFHFSHSPLLLLPQCVRVRPFGD